jgi:hypothetical protein
MNRYFGYKCIYLLCCLRLFIAMWKNSILNGEEQQPVFRIILRSKKSKRFELSTHSICVLFQLVGHGIEAGGKLFSGGRSFNGPVSDGLHFEITMLQFYNVALSAGKAHRDHKHHHVHHFDHNGPITSTPAPPLPPVSYHNYSSTFFR